MISQELKAKIANKFNLSPKAVDDQIYRLQKKGELNKQPQKYKWPVVLQAQTEGLSLDIFNSLN